jgi:hypothetical protein
MAATMPAARSLHKFGAAARERRGRGEAGGPEE